MSRIFFISLSLPLVVLFLLFNTSFIFSQDTDAASELRQKREKILLYGLNNEIIELVKYFNAEKDLSYSRELLNLFKSTNNPDIQRNIIELYSEAGSAELLDAAVEKIKNREYENRGVVISAIRYVARTDNKNYNDLFLSLLDDYSKDFKKEAVKALSLSKDKKYSPYLIDLYQKGEESDVKLQILLDIGELGDSDSAEFLENIASDTENDRTSRQYALHSLGKIGAERSFDVLFSAWKEDDPLIRIYALSALSNYDKKEVNTVLFESLKDENWRIRKEAVTTAGKTGDKEFLDILFYRSDNDPVEDIRNESLKSIAEIGGTDAFDFIRDKAENPRTSPKTRILAFTIAVTKDLSGSLEMIDSQLEKEWNAAVKTLLENFCSELSKIKSNQLDQYFEKMLDHPSVVVKVSGLRGIRLNRIARLREKVKEISEDKRQPLSVRNNALAALEQL